MLKNRKTSYFRTIATVHILVLLVLVINNSPAYAEDRCISPGNVLSVVTADWNDDAVFDRAVLAVSERDPVQSELFLYLSGAAPNSLTLAAYNTNIAWVGSLWGTLPSLDMHTTGSLVVTSANQSIGRHRWTQKLTVAYRRDVFVVAGYTFSAYDTLDPNGKIDCDVNLLTGKGIKNGTAFTSSAKAVAVVEWSETSIPEECR